MATVTFEHVTKRFGEVKAVNDLSLQIRDKEFMVLVGPSGPGKSTALRLLAGLDELTEGEIRIGKRVATDLPPKDRNIAMVFQTYALYPHLDVKRNMALALQQEGVAKARIDERVARAAGHGPTVSPTCTRWPSTRPTSHSDGSTTLDRVLRHRPCCFVTSPSASSTARMPTRRRASTPQAEASRSSVAPPRSGTADQTR